MVNCEVLVRDVLIESVFVYLVGFMCVIGYVWVGFLVIIFFGWFVVMCFSVICEFWIWDIMVLCFGIGVFFFVLMIMCGLLWFFWVVWR